MTPATQTSKSKAKPEEQKATPAPAPQPQAAPSKQEATLNKLREAWAAKGVSLVKLTFKMDGKFMLVEVGEGWPTVRIGQGGGIELPAIRSYPKAFDAAVDGKALLEKQNARAAKKSAPATPPVAAKPAPATAKPVAAETPAQRKSKQHADLEKQMA